MLPVIKVQLGEMSASGIRLTGGDAIVAERGDLVWAADRPRAVRLAQHAAHPHQAHLTKLEVTTRRAAVRRAPERGLM